MADNLIQEKISIFKDLINTVGFPIIAATALFWQVHLFRTELLQEFKEMNKNLNAVVTKVEIHDIRINKLENSRK
ncbi:MAG: hypothetical protein ACRCYA_10580 [Cetobacterium sp.]|uniref:hypothetical protein n=1 Tax=Cetobacterium sp. TaxID=2071632 RepID=UPI003F34A5B1